MKEVFLSTHRRNRALAFGGLVVFSLASPVSIAATNMAWAGALVLALYQHFYRPSREGVSFQRTDLDNGFALFFLASLLSLGVSLNPWASLVELRSLGLIVIYYLFAWNVKSLNDLRWLIDCLLGSACLAVIYGYFQYLTGWDLLGHYRPGLNQISGFFSLHLTFATYLVMTTCLGTGIILWADLTRPELFRTILAVMLMGGGVQLSGAKGAYIGLFVGGMTLFGLRSKKHFLGALAAAGIILLLFAGWKSGIVIKYYQSLFTVDAVSTSGQAASNIQRPYMWWAGLRISARHFLNGVGPHAVEAIYPSFRHPLARDPNQWHLHNQFIQIGVTRGLFGLIAFLFLFFKAFQINYYRLRHGREGWRKGISAGLLAGLIGFLICGLTEYSWGDSEVLMLLYMLLGLSAALSIIDKESPLQIRKAVSPHPFEESGSRIKEILFASMIILLIIVSFLSGSEENKGLQLVILQILSGILLMGVSLAGQLNLPPSPLRQTVACLVISCGYSLTWTFWAGGEEILAGQEAFLTLLTAGACLLLALFILIGIFFLPRAVMTLFDLTVFSGTFLWMLLSLATSLLLVIAGAEKSLNNPILVLLLVLGVSVTVLYGTTRFLYRGDTTQKVLLVFLGLCTLWNAF